MSSEIVTQFEVLRDYLGKIVALEIECKREHCIGNLDDGEDTYNLEETTKTARHRFQNIYFSTVNNWGKPSCIPIFISACAAENQQLLIPFSYFYIPIFHIRRSSETVGRELSCIRSEDGLEFRIKSKHLSFMIFDGYGNVSKDPDGHYSDEYVNSLERYPSLSKKNCSYDENLLGIKGNIENLLLDCVPAW